MHLGLHQKLVMTLEGYEASTAGAGDVQSAPASPKVSVDGFTPEAVLVGRLLRRDFEKFGVHLAVQQREEVACLTAQVHSLGMRFGHNLTDPRQFEEVAIPADRAARLGNVAYGMGWPGHGPLMLGTHAGSFMTALRNIPDEHIRRQVYIATYSSPRDNLECAEELLNSRHLLAQLLGASSHAQYVADAATLAATPEAAYCFTTSLARLNLARAKDEAESLRKMKAADQGLPLHAVQLQAWDRAYYMYQSQIAEKVPDGSAQYRLSSCLEAMKKLVDRVFNLVLLPVQLTNEEAWAPGLQKMEVWQKGGDLLGQIYLDLHPRAGKFGHAAHFTLRCGRQLENGERQTAVVALVCNLEGGPKAPLTQQQVETLFHEFGHALHSLVSRTEYQHLAGTRGSLDTVEIVSHLLELFAKDAPSMATLLSPDAKRDSALEASLRQAMVSRRRFPALQLELKLLDSMMDQVLHSGPCQGDAAQRVAHVLQQFSATPFVPGTAPHLRFGHLVGYGGSYYSYLYAERIAAAIWQQLFQDDPLDPSAGEVVRTRLLEVGGAKPPLQLVEDVLGKGYMQPTQGGWMPPLHNLPTC
eukprot:jgi/Botrbrau1/9349/Bobra.354_2s0008.2